MQLWRRHPWLLRTAALFVSAAAAVLPAVLSPQAVSGIEDRVGDLFWRVGASSRAERRVVLVDIDEASLRELGAWPWSRNTMAELASRLNDAGARVQAYDITFADSRAGDEALQAAWSSVAPVVAQLFSVDPAVTPTTGTLAGALATPGCPPFAPPSFGHYGTSGSLLAARPVIGHITPRVGADGVVRQLPAVICRDGRSYVSLALATLWRAAQADPAPGAAGVSLAGPDWEWNMSAGSLPFSAWLAPTAWLTSASLPGWVVPLDDQGNMRVPYALRRQAFASISAAEVIKGRVNLDPLRGAIVVVGATAFGMGDTVATPHGAVASGLEVHTQALVGLLDQNIPYTPRHWPKAQAFVLMGLALALLAVAVRKRGVPAKRLPLIGLALAGACVVGSAVALLQFGLWLPWLSIFLFVVLASLSLATVEHAFARAQRERLSAHLGAYLPAPVAQRLMASDPSGSLQFEQRDVSVLAVDIRNFTALATHCRPEEVAILLHSFCCQAVDVVERHGGVVENVVGSKVVAVWNASSPECADHPWKALAAAKEMVRDTRQLLASGHPIADDSPVQPLALGIGLESGVAIVGSFGPARRRVHAALGEPVSVANRIQEMTADLSMPILVGPQLAALLPAISVEPLGEYLLEGLGKHYQMFAPVGWADLVSVDPNWATSAVDPVDRQADASEWSRWGDTSRAEPSPSGTRRARFTLQRRNA